MRGDEGGLVHVCVRAAGGTGRQEGLDEILNTFLC